MVHFYVFTEFEASKVAINGQYNILNHPALLTAPRQWLFVSRFPSYQLNKANSSDTEDPVLILDMSITICIVSSKTFMINGMILILKWLISHFLMEMFLAPLSTVWIELRSGHFWKRSGPPKIKEQSTHAM